MYTECAYTRIFLGHVHKCNPGLNFVDEIRSTKTEKFYTPRKFVPLFYLFVYMYMLLCMCVCVYMCVCVRVFVDMYVCCVHV